MMVHWQHHQDSLRPVRAFSKHETRSPPNNPFNAQRQLLTSKWAPFLLTGWRLTLNFSTSEENFKVQIEVLKNRLTDFGERHEDT